MNFENVAVDHFEPYTTTERVSRQVYGGKYSGTRTVWEDRTVTKNERKSEIGAAEIISFLVTAQLGNSAVTQALPPYGEVSRDTQERNIGYLTDFSTADRFYWSYYLTNDASRPWRFGLEPFHYRWELEDVK